MRKTAATVADAFANENAFPHDAEGRFLVSVPQYPGNPKG